MSGQANSARHVFASDWFVMPFVTMACQVRQIQLVGSLLLNGHDICYADMLGYQLSLSGLPDFAMPFVMLFP
jgi:hypothetical protein